MSLDSCEQETDVERVSTDLVVGLESDIWFDANGSDNDSAKKTIETAKKGMHDAVILLGKMDKAIQEMKASLAQCRLVLTPDIIQMIQSHAAPGCGTQAERAMISTFYALDNAEHSTSLTYKGDWQKYPKSQPPRG